MAELLDGNKKDVAQNPKKTTKTAVSTKVDQLVLRWAKTVASYRGIDLYDYLHSILSEHVGKDYRTTVREPEGE